MELIIGESMKSTSIKEVSINEIKLARNSRLNVSDEEIAGLMASIKEVGLLQPIGVTKSTKGYEIVYGNRRFLAMSKLGIKKIPVVIHNNKKEVENDLQNLTENLQRRNISLTEAGRYMEILQKAGLSPAEIAVRLGVTKNYVKSCMDAFQNVPLKFRDDLDVKTTNDRQRTPGKISIKAANAVINAAKSYNLSITQKEKLLSEAKSNPNFVPENVRKYAAALVSGEKDPVGSVPEVKFINVNFWMEEREYNRLWTKYITKGQFNTFGQVMKAILKGEISEHVKMK